MSKKSPPRKGGLGGPGHGEAGTPEAEAERHRKIAEALRRFWDDPERSAEARQAVSGPQSEETRAKKRAKQLAYWDRRRAAEAAREGEPPAGR